MKTIHLWSVNGDDFQAAVVDGDVRDVAVRTMLRHHSDSARLVSRTIQLDGWVVRLEYEATTTTKDGLVGKFRHIFQQPSDSWPMVPASELVDVIGR